MNLARPTQFGIFAVLALLMILTRGHHFASVDALPSASWAVFFLAGVFFRPLWGLAALMLVGTTLDLSALESGQISDWCLSPAYWSTLAAYAALWSAGRIYSRFHADRALSVLPLGLSLIAGAFVAYLLSGGGFYFFSGRYTETNFSEFALRIAHYYPLNLGNLSTYVGVAALVYVVARLIQRNAAPAQTIAR